MLSFVRPALVAAGCALVAAATLPACAALVDPDAPSVLLDNGQVPGVVDKLINRGDYNDALKLIAEGLKSNPHSAQLRFQRCVVYERMGDRDKANSSSAPILKSPRHTTISRGSTRATATSCEPKSFL
jgi:Flp pilus assembly protein TadD